MFYKNWPTLAPTHLSHYGFRPRVASNDYALIVIWAKFTIFLIGHIRFAYRLHFAISAFAINPTRAGPYMNWNLWHPLAIEQMGHFRLTFILSGLKEDHQCCIAAKSGPHLHASWATFRNMCKPCCKYTNLRTKKIFPIFLKVP